MITELYSLNHSKSFKQTLLIRLALTPLGLPKTNLIFCRREHMVKWDCKTGEVSTIEYGSGKQYDKAWIDE